MYHPVIVPKLDAAAVAADSYRLARRLIDRADVVEGTVQISRTDLVILSGTDQRRAAHIMLELSYTGILTLTTQPDQMLLVAFPAWDEGVPYA